MHTQFLSENLQKKKKRGLPEDLCSDGRILYRILKKQGGKV